MPMKKSYRKKALGKKPYKKRTYKTVTASMNNSCKIVQTLPSVNVLANTPYIISVGGITGARAQAVAEQFGLYRISRISYKFKPNLDTFDGNNNAANGPVTVPTLYWKMNRFADAPAAFNATDLKALGSKPIRFDDKQISISYKPNILTGIATAGDNSGSLKMTPWLNTDAAPDTGTFAISDTEHYGHFHVVECAMAGNGSLPVGTFDATIYYEFKNPRTKWTPASEESKELIKNVM